MTATDQPATTDAVLEQLRAAVKVRDEARGLEREVSERVLELAAEARAAGVGMTELGRVLGVKRQRVYQLLGS